MNESGKKKSDGLFIAGGIALIAVLVIAIKLIFAWLGAAVPPERLNPDLAQSQGVTEQMETDTPAFSRSAEKRSTTASVGGSSVPGAGRR